MIDVRVIKLQLPLGVASGHQAELDEVVFDNMC